MSHELAKTVNGQLALNDYGIEEGQTGFEGTDTNDFTIPYLTILQGISPQIGGAPDDRIEGAAIGDLMISSTKEIFKGKEGLIFQPCDKRTIWVEWTPRKTPDGRKIAGGGKFVATHEPASDVVRKAIATQKFPNYSTDAGNVLQDTRYFAGLIHRTLDLDEQSKLPPEELIISFSVTKIKPYKAYMDKIKSVKFGGQIPLYANRILITSFTDSVGGGEPFQNFRLTPAIDNNVKSSIIPSTYITLLGYGKATLNSYRSSVAKGGTDEAVKEEVIPF